MSSSQAQSHYSVAEQRFQLTPVRYHPHSVLGEKHGLGDAIAIDVTDGDRSRLVATLQLTPLRSPPVSAVAAQLLVSN
jgi:hypothetical protein